MRKYNCKFCGLECQSRDKRSVTCKSNECLNAKMRERYETDLHELNCKSCEKLFSGTYRTLLCESCSDAPRTIEFEIIKRKYTCQTCGIVLGEVNVKKAGKYRPSRSLNKSRRTCDECKEKNRKQLSASRFAENNPNWKGGVAQKVSEKQKQINNQKASERMKFDNPMKDLSVVDKVKTTLKRKIASGELKYVVGPAHHLWKGNRTGSQVIRSRLYNTWVYPLLKAANFTCSLCGLKGKRLEVHHHDKPFRDIVKNFTSFPLDQLSEEEFEKISKLVVNYHLTDVKGTVCCVQCHRKIDPMRK